VRASQLCVLPLLALASFAPAEQIGVLDYRVRSREPLFPGVETGTYVFNTRRGQTTALTIEAQLSHPRVYTDWLASTSGVLRAGELQPLAEEAEVRAVYGLELQPRIDGVASLQGVRFERGTLHSWPPKGPHLLIRPEGSAAFVSLEPGTATLAFDDETSMTISALNGRLPASNVDGALYTGSLAAEDFVNEPGWQECVLARLTPIASGPPAPERWLLPDPEKRRWQIVEVVDLANGRLRANEAGLVVRRSNEPKLRAVMERRGELRSTITLDPRIESARIVFPVGELLLQRGEVVAANPDEPFGNAVFLDVTGTRLALMSSADFARRGIGLTATQAAEIFGGEGYTEAARLPITQHVLLPDVQRRDVNREQANTRVRSALGFRAGVEILALPEGGAGLSLLSDLVVEGLGTPFPVNGPLAVVDQRIGFDGGLGHFWAARWEPPAECGLRVRLPEPRRVGLVELVHAGAGGFSPELGLRAFRLEIRPSAQDPWSSVATIRHDNPVDRERIGIPGTPLVGELRLLVDEPSFVPGGNVARLVELYVWAAE